MPSTPEVFERSRLIDLCKHEKREFDKLRQDASRLIPRVDGNPYSISGYTVIGMEHLWSRARVGFNSFKADMGQRRSLKTIYHTWGRNNESLPYVNANIQVQLTRKALVQVCNAVRQELEKTEDLEQVLQALIARNVPSDNQRVFANVVQLRDFIQRHKLAPKRKAQLL